MPGTEVSRRGVWCVRTRRLSFIHSFIHRTIDHSKFLFLIRNSRHIFCKVSSDFKSALCQKISYLTFSALPEFVLFIKSFKSSFPLCQGGWQEDKCLSAGAAPRWDWPSARLAGPSGETRQPRGLPILCVRPRPQHLLLLTMQFWTYRIMLTIL